MKGIVDILIIIAAIRLVVGVIIKAAGLGAILWCNLIPTSFLKFSNTCLLVAIALGVRQIWVKKA